MVAAISVTFPWGNFSKVAFWPLARFLQFNRGRWAWPNGKYAMLIPVYDFL